jgi:hypothetical protein
MSLPPEVSFRYVWRPETGSPEARVYEHLLVPRDWLTRGPSSPTPHTLSQQPSEYLCNPFYTYRVNPP